MDIKLFCFDFDGTALGGYEPYQRFPPNFCNFLDELSKDGIRWCTNTTWHPYAQAQVISASSLQSRPIALLGSSGIDKGVYVNDTVYLDAEWAFDLTNSYLEYGLNILPEVKIFLKKGIKDIVWKEKERYIIQVQAKEGNIKRVISKLRSNILVNEKCFLMPDACMDTINIYPGYISKGRALKRLQAELHIGSDATLVAGDEENDLTMFNKEVALYQVAPGNASALVKKRLLANNGKVSKVNYSDGIIDAVNSFRKNF